MVAFRAAYRCTHIAFGNRHFRPQRTGLFVAQSPQSIRQRQSLDHRNDFRRRIGFTRSGSALHASQTSTRMVADSELVARGTMDKRNKERH